MALNMVPVVAVNYKAYPTAFGEKGLAIAMSADKVAREYSGSVKVIIAVPATELSRIAEVVEDAIVYAEHVDPIEPGAHTGFIPMEALKALDVRGTLVNHSEHQLKLSEIDFIIRRATAMGIETMVCADTATAAAAVAALSPTWVAVEPPELIGTGIPVSRAKPEIIMNTVKLVHRVNPELPVLAGAGITRGEDVEAAIRLGAVGVLVASAVMKAPDPEARIRELVEAAYRATH
ncbi:MAG: triose-phosphate isomerase [Crenarchaeota archaeon]|nr:triose-phosphate isomerase [Thermoproteota archaeon]